MLGAIWWHNNMLHTVIAVLWWFDTWGPSLIFTARTVEEYDASAGRNYETSESLERGEKNKTVTLNRWSEY